ncbi:MAG TPA: PIN domain-containing protein [Actinomycetota bacterium]|nr:PIN domain-containing protein [Actinomycetota bacterium]
MGAVVLDTTVLIDYLRGRPRTVARLTGLESIGDQPYVCAISVEEVTRGLRPVEDDTFVDLLEGVRVAPLGVPEGRLAGYWRRTMSKRGRTVLQADALIAAASVGVGARVATGNPRDFAFPGVAVEHWPVGE